MEIYRIYLKIFDSLRLDFSKISYAKKVENGYTQISSIYNLIICSEVNFYDPKDYNFKNILEIPFDTEFALDNYVDKLDDLSNSDLIIVYTDNQNSSTSFDGLRYLKVVLPITIDGQTIFNTPTTILTFDTLLFVNGLKQKHPEDYIISGNTITYSNRSYLLSTTDELEIYYISN